MFVIVGLKSRRSTVDTGRFHCPNEDATRPYHHQRLRRWFTLFLVPIIPLDRQGEWVQCDGCGATSGTDVLARHPAGSP